MAATMEKSYHVINLKKYSEININKVETGFEIMIEDQSQIIKIEFNDLKTLCEIMFFEIAFKIQPFIKE